MIPAADAAGQDVGRPSLPPGYQAQVAWGFRDPAGGLSYELNRVYGPPGPDGWRGPLCQLDQDMTYWSVTVAPAGESEDAQRPAAHWLTYAQARKIAGPRSHLTFERFCSVAQMRGRLRALMRIA